LASPGEWAVEDMIRHLEKLRSDASECALIRDLAIDKTKRELFARLEEHLATLAKEVERALAARGMECGSDTAR